MVKTNKLCMLLVSVAAVFMLSIFAVQFHAFADETLPENAEQAAVTQQQSADQAAAEGENLAESTEEAPKSNPLLSGIILVIAVGAVAVCVMEIRKDNKR